MNRKCIPRNIGTRSLTSLNQSGAYGMLSSRKHEQKYKVSTLRNGYLLAVNSESDVSLTRGCGRY
jgi:hypothetical protein